MSRHCLVRFAAVAAMGLAALGAPPADAQPGGGSASAAAPSAKRDFGAEWSALTRRAQGIQADGDDGAKALEALLAAFQAARSAALGKAVELYPDDKERDFASSVDDPGAEPGIQAKANKLLVEMRSAGVFERLAELGRFKGISHAAPGPDEPMIELGLPELGLIRYIARAQSRRLTIAAQRGNWHEVQEVVQQTLPLARLYQGQTLTIQQLVGLAIESLVSRGLADQLTGRITDADACAAIRAALDALPPFDPAAGLSGDQLAVLDNIARTAPAEGSRTVASAADQSAQADRFFRQAKALVAQEPASRQKLAAALDQQVVDLPDRFKILKSTFPSMAKIAVYTTQAQVKREGTRTLLAIEAYRIRRGQLPERLEQLVPEFLKSLPSDPYAPSAQPFRYKVIANPAADRAKRPYLLYSVGLDGTDNGGNQHPKNNYDAATDKGKGFDLLINPLPELVK